MSERSGRSRSLSPRPRDCYNCGKTGHFVKDCHRESACYYCGKGGHIAAECRKRSPGEHNQVRRSASPSQDHGKETLNSKGGDIGVLSVTPEHQKH